MQSERDNTRYKTIQTYIDFQNLLNKRIGQNLHVDKIQSQGLPGKAKTSIPHESNNL